MAEVWLDARSAATSRLTGWERYSRSIVSMLVLSPKIIVSMPPQGSVVRRVWSDWAPSVRQAKHNDIAHFLSFPPAPGIRGRKRTFVTLFDLTWWMYPETSSSLGLRYYRPLMERALRAADVVIAPTVTVAGEIADRFEVADVAVIAPVPAALPVTDPWQNPSGRPYVVAVGSIEPRKNLSMLSRAFEDPDLRKELDLVIVGRQAWGGLPDNALVLGAVDDQVMSSVLRGSSGLVVPSLYEGFGLPLVESLAIGVPVLCSDIAVFREVAGSHATYFNSSSVDDIRHSLWRSVGARKASTVANFGVERTRREVTDLYKKNGVELW